MKKLLFAMFVSTFALNASAAPASEENGGRDEQTTLATRNLERSMALVDGVISKCFIGSGAKMEMKDVYDLNRHAREDGTSDVWPYTAVMEAVNSIIEGIDELKEEAPEFYELDRERYVNLLNDLYRSIRYYAGSYKLVSYARTEDWMDIYGVHRGARPGAATVTGIENVYDDQMWLAREFIRAYKNTGMEGYKTRAEYLIEYILDGWDVCVDSRGEEYGGITWGPGYYTKHSCSNGPFVSPLVWLSQIYSGKGQTIEYRYIGEGKKRLTRTMDKSEYYLMYAEKVYNFQRTHLYKKSEGVYWDMLGAKGAGGDNIAYETVDGVRYRGHNEEENPLGESYSYNSGTMLSGAADLYGVTGRQEYLDDMKALSVNSFRAFAKKCTKYPELYEYAVDGFNNWFNGVLLRGWVAVSEHYPNVDVQVSSFQNNLDHAYSLYLKNDMLPSSLIYGWNTNESQNNVEAMFTFAFAAEYAVMANYYLNK